MINVECISSWVDLVICQIVKFSKYRVIFIYFQAAVSAVLAASVLHVENKIKINVTWYSEIRKFDTHQIAFLMRCFKNSFRTFCFYTFSFWNFFFTLLKSWRFCKHSLDGPKIVICKRLSLRGFTFAFVSWKLKITLFPTILYLRMLENLLLVYTVQSRFSDILFSDNSRFSDNFAEDHFFST